MTTPPMTLEDRINAIINDPQFEKELAMRGILLPEFQLDWNTFGGFEKLPVKYQRAIDETERRAARKAQMTLDETKEVLQSLRNRGTPRMRAAIDSALHYLEAGKRECSCNNLKIAIRDGSLQIRNSIPSISGCYIQHCPWCGGTLSPQPQQEGQR